MKIMIGEYAVGSGYKELMLEGRLMLNALVESFTKCGHEVFYPTTKVELEIGHPIKTEKFEDAILELSKTCEAGLVIAPDDILDKFTEIIDKNTINLGCPSNSVRLCADKLKCTQTLEKANIPVPNTIENGEYNGIYIVKPRYGCASVDTYKSTSGILKKDYIATEFIEGEHLSVSLVSGKTQLPLTLNCQFIEFDNNNISYKGGIISYDCNRNEEVIEVAKKTVKLLGCKGYVGVDIVLGDKPYVVDVNPRPTTSIIGITKVLDVELGELIIKARFGELPEIVGVSGSHSFIKSQL